MIILVFTLLCMACLALLIVWLRARTREAFSRRRFDLLYHSAPVGIAFLDSQYHITDVNQRFLDIFQIVSRESMSGYALNEDPNYSDCFKRYIERGDVGPFDVEYRFSEENPPFRYATHGKESVFLEMLIQSADAFCKDSRSGHVIMLRNSTPRHQAENNLRYQQEFFSALVDKMPVGVFVKDIADGFRYTLWNNYLEREFNLLRDDVLHKCDSQIFNKETARNSRQHDLEVVYAAAPMNVEATGSYFGVGDDRICSIIKAPLVDHTGRVTALMGVVRDITIERQQEQVLHHARKMDAVGRLAGGVAHDLNNMLQAILGYTDMVLEDISEHPDVTENLGEVMRAGRRAMIMVRQLLAFSRRDILEPQRVNINAQTTEIVGLIRRMVGDGIEVLTANDEALVEVYGDPAQIEQILINLCLNARDALDGQGTITIKTENLRVEEKDFQNDVKFLAPGEYAVLRVQDTGCGMAEDVRQRIFEPFFTTKDVDRGAGLGLATVYAIVKKHQAEIRCTSRVGVGTEFSVYFKAFNLSDQEPLKAARNLSDTLDTILLVEDDEQVRILTAETLRKQGFEVKDVADVASAKQLLAGDLSIKAVVSDVVMPEESGWQLYKYVKANRPEIPIVLCSAYSDRELPDELVRNGSVSLLRKPFTKEQLLEAVCKAAGQTNDHDSSE